MSLVSCIDVSESRTMSISLTSTKESLGLRLLLLVGRKDVDGLGAGPRSKSSSWSMAIRLAATLALALVVRFALPVVEVLLKKPCECDFDCDCVCDENPIACVLCRNSGALLVLLCTVVTFPTRSDRFILAVRILAVAGGFRGDLGAVGMVVCAFWKGLPALVLVLVLSVFVVVDLTGVVAILRMLLPLLPWRLDRAEVDKDVLLVLLLLLLVDVRLLLVAVAGKLEKEPSSSAKLGDRVVSVSSSFS